MFRPKATESPTIKRTSVRAWEKGTVTNLDDGRTPVDGLRSSGNVILTQDSTVRPRGSLTLYGPQPTGTIRGQVYEFLVTSGADRTIWMICMQDDGTNGKVYVAKGEDTTWTECTGATYDQTAPAHFMQIADKILVMNGVDNLSYVDTSDFTITTYTQLTDPASAMTGTLTGLTGTSFKIYYAYTANSTIGETAPSPILTKSISTDRDLWDPSTQSIALSWTAITGAESYNIYMGVAADGAGVPKLYPIATALDPSLTAWTDTGVADQDLSRRAPTGNSTAGPKVTRAEVISGRIWMVGDTDNPYYVWRGGDYGHELDFSPSNGGGYTPIGTGTKDVPNSIKSFRDGQGNQKVMVLCQGTNGSGKRFYLSPTTVTYGNSSFTVWQADEDYGQDGTDSPDGVIVYQNSTFYPSRDGFKTTGTKPQLQNVLSTDRISNTIQADISTINTSSADKTVGLAYEGRLYWALPIGASKNNQVWILDLDRKGAWMKPLNIMADWMWLYNDNSGRTHFCFLVNNQILEMSYSAKTSDNGVAFSTSINSGQTKFTEDGREWGSLIQLVFVLLRPQGEVTFSASVKTEDGIIPFEESETFGANSSRVGIDEPIAIDSPLRAIDAIYGVPQDLNEAVVEYILEIGEEAQWYQYGISTTKVGVDYNLSDVVAEYVPIGIKDLS